MQAVGRGPSKLRAEPATDGGQWTIEFGSAGIPPAADAQCRKAAAGIVTHLLAPRRKRKFALLGCNGMLHR
jgi:hypothetical protein